VEWSGVGWDGVEWGGVRHLMSPVQSRPSLLCSVLLLIRLVFVICYICGIWNSEYVVSDNVVEEGSAGEGRGVKEREGKGEEGRGRTVDSVNQSSTSHL
jgi:hypothetical protein